MRVLIADKFPERGRAALGELGLEVVFRPDLDAEGLPGAAAEVGANILVVRSTRVEGAVFESTADVALVVRAGAGVNTIDLQAASRRGVFVANCPGKNAIAVAELTMGLILAVDRHLPDAIAEMRAGHWDKRRYGRARGLFGQTLGLVGFGNIAQEVAHRARSFGLRVLAHARTLDAAKAEAHGVEPTTLEDILHHADIVSLHLPHTSETHHRIGKSELAMMKEGAVLIHTGRGGVVDDAALAQAAASGHIRAALDVHEAEPGASDAAFDSPLRDLTGVYATPHIGASTAQAESAIADEVVRIIRDYRRHGTVHNTVNLVKDRPARWTVVVRHLDRVGVLAKVLDAMREEQLNVQEMQNIVFSGDEAACATITLERQPSNALVQGLQQHEHILAVEVREVRPHIGD